MAQKQTAEPSREDDFPEVFGLRLRFLPDWACPARPRAIRARLLLKSILRGHRVRCIGLGDDKGHPLPPLPAWLDPCRAEPPF